MEQLSAPLPKASTSSQSGPEQSESMQQKHSHPLLCLDGVSSGELQFVLDYIYHGEVQIHEEQLDRFLEVAKKLKLEGLTNEDGEHRKEANETLEEAVAIEIETEEEEIVIRKAATNTEEID